MCIRDRLSSSIPSIVSWHRPQFFLTPQRAYTSSAHSAPPQIAAPMRCSFSLLQTQTIIQPTSPSENKSQPQTIYYQLRMIHISEPTRLLSISYAVFCLKKKKKYI